METTEVGTQRIDGSGKQVLVLEQDDYSALSALLYELIDRKMLRQIASEHGMALGSNQIESLSGLWEKLN